MMTTKLQKTVETARGGADWLQRFVRLLASCIRQKTVCKLGEHWNWKRLEPERGIAGAGVCLDCGAKWEGLKPFVKSK